MQLRSTKDKLHDLLRAYANAGKRPLSRQDFKALGFDYARKKNAIDKGRIS